MNNDQLETLLNQQVSRETPVPGFETKLKALAASELASKTQSQVPLLKLFAGVSGLSIIALIATPLFLQTEKKKEPSVVQISPPNPRASLPPITSSPLHQELYALQNDASRTLQFLSERLPGLPRTF